MSPLSILNSNPQQQRFSAARALRYLLGGLTLLCADLAWADACGGLTFEPQHNEQGALATEVAKQLHVEHITIKQAYRSDAWSIFYIVTNEQDRTFVIYSGDPLSSRYVTLWGGMPDDYNSAQILDWAHSNAPGIPEALAQCLSSAAMQDHAP